jgi:hypothetical protein
MRNQSTTQAAQGTSNWLALDKYSTDQQASFYTAVTGTLTYDIEYTYDNVFDSSITPTAFKLTGATGLTAAKDGSAMPAASQPVAAIRVNITAFTSGSVKLTLMQAGLR